MAKKVTTVRCPLGSNVSDLGCESLRIALSLDKSASEANVLPENGGSKGANRKSYYSLKDLLTGEKRLKDYVDSTLSEKQASLHVLSLEELLTVRGHNRNVPRQFEKTQSFINELDHRIAVQVVELCIRNFFDPSVSSKTSNFLRNLMTKKEPKDVKTRIGREILNILGLISLVDARVKGDMEWFKLTCAVEQRIYTNLLHYEGAEQKPPPISIPSKNFRENNELPQSARSRPAGLRGRFDSENHKEPSAKLNNDSRLRSMSFHPGQTQPMTVTLFFNPVELFLTLDRPKDKPFFVYESSSQQTPGERFDVFEVGPNDPLNKLPSTNGCRQELLEKIQNRRSEATTVSSRGQTVLPPTTRAGKCPNNFKAPVISPSSSAKPRMEKKNVFGDVPNLAQTQAREDGAFEQVNTSTPEKNEITGFEEEANYAVQENQLEENTKIVQSNVIVRKSFTCTFGEMIDHLQQTTTASSAEVTCQNGRRTERSETNEALLLSKATIDLDTGQSLQKPASQRNRISKKKEQDGKSPIRADNILAAPDSKCHLKRTSPRTNGSQKEASSKEKSSRVKAMKESALGTSISHVVPTSEIPYKSLHPSHQEINRYHKPQQENLRHTPSYLDDIRLHAPFPSRLPYQDSSRKSTDKKEFQETRTQALRSNCRESRRTSQFSKHDEQVGRSRCKNSPGETPKTFAQRLERRRSSSLLATEETPANYSPSKHINSFDRRKSKIAAKTFDSGRIKWDTHPLPSHARTPRTNHHREACASVRAETSLGRQELTCPADSNEFSRRIGHSRKRQGVLAREDEKSVEVAIPGSSLKFSSSKFIEFPEFIWEAISPDSRERVCTASSLRKLQLVVIREP